MMSLSLFLLLSVEVIECDEHLLKVKEGKQVYEIDFFNILFYDDEKRNLACKYLKDADNVELEEEKLAQNSFYIFVDGQLLQKIILDQEWGKVNLNYPEYLHQLETEKLSVMANYQQVNTNNSSILILCGLFLFILLCLGSVFLL